MRPTKKLLCQTTDACLPFATKPDFCWIKTQRTAPADDSIAEKQFANKSDDQTPLLMDQMDQTGTIWCPTDTRLDTSPICHIRCTFAHTNGHVFQHTPSIQCPVHDQHENGTQSRVFACAESSPSSFRK